MNNFIVVSLTGGLGDQINQYIFGRILSEKLNCELILDTSYYKKKIQFKFRGLKNAGTAPLTITKIMPMNSNMKIIDKQTPFILKPGESFDFTAEQLLQKGGTAVENMDQNGVVNYEQTIMVMTDGKKQKYQLFCRQKMFFFDGNR